MWALKRIYVTYLYGFASVHHTNENIQKMCMLHSNLSPFVTVPATPFPHVGGFIPGLVRSDIT